MKAQKLLSVALLLCLAGFVGASLPAQAQSKESAKVLKENRQLGKKIDKAKKAIQDNKKALDSALSDYNALVDGKAANPTKAHAKLVKVAATLEKASSKRRSSVDAMRSGIQTFFKSWENELDTYASPDLRTASEERLRVARGRHDQLENEVARLSAQYGQYLISFSDHLRYMGRDLSPNALLGLSGETARFNGEAGQLNEQIRVVLDHITEMQLTLNP